MNLEWSEHMHETVILWSWLSLVSTATTRGSIRPALRSETPSASKTTFLFSSSACVSGVGAPPLPSAPSCDGSTGAEDTSRGGDSRGGASCGGASRGSRGGASSGFGAASRGALSATSGGTTGAFFAPP